LGEIDLTQDSRNRVFLYQMDRYPGGQFPYAAFFWPALAAASAGEIASSFAAHFLGSSGDADGDHTPQAPEGVTPIGRLFMTDWRSANADMRFLGIDEYLADLNVLVDRVGGLVDLVGLCQGGWLSLVYAGRFPTKVRKLVMAGAPIDIAAGQSRLSAKAEATPLVTFQSLLNFGDGRVIGRNLAKFWENETDASSIRESLQTLCVISLRCGIWSLSGHSARR
jgi:poly(3-hydroxybutyrate) depolymerase